MAFAILRTQKLKAAVAVRRSLKHAFRAQDTPNADPTRLGENSHLGANSVDEAMKAFQNRLPEKIRKNGVLAIEYLITGSPDGMNNKSRRDQDAYFTDALAWLKERHGAENLIYAGIHRDETTPHLYAYVVPIDPQGKLNCRHFLGGAKALSQMQTDFAEQVGQRHGLQRGIEGSKAKHTTVRQYYASLQQDSPAPLVIPAQALAPRVLKNNLFSRIEEAPEVVASRLSRETQAHYAPAMARAKRTDLAERRAKELAATAQAKEVELQVLRPLVEGLPPEELEAVRRFAEELRAEAAKRQEQERRVAALPHLVRKHGPVATFARLAIEAIKQVADAWQAVDWKALEQRAFKQIMQDGWSPRRGMKAIVDHSPAHAGQSQEQLNAVLASLSDQPIVDKPARANRPGPSYSR
ncbi:MobV family relaxase [Aeromonas veronii]|uniref:MobV family relaxase n=1 Tax=Aeromonas veronii TaxID=654 RepID=UPI001D0B2952|nr:MobV family relaxase [Aeromonas veronii]MCC0091414.1 plasmid recombination protein [Aeromonas veronii]